MRADWSGHAGAPTADRYIQMARVALHGVSPSYERICLGIGDDPVVLGLLDTLPYPKRQPNLLLGAVRFTGGPVDSYQRFRAFLLEHWDDVDVVMRTHRTQTNEAWRTAALLPVLAALPQPLALLEVGASAGLCLQPDRYAYRYDDGPLLGESELTLPCATSGPVPVPGRLPDVAWRAGLDLNPLDVHDPESMRWLEALVWPEERVRFEVLRAAVGIARRDPPAVTAGDLTADLVPLASQAPQDATLVVFHSAVLAYLDDRERAAFRRQLDTVREDRPLVWLGNEAPGVVVDVPGADERDDFVLSRDGVPLAWADGHGGSLDWFA